MVTISINGNLDELDDNAYKLLEEIKKDVKANGEDFKTQFRWIKQYPNENSHISNTLLTYSKFLFGKVIVDATSKTNRFNMLLINVICVNNYWRTNLLALG